MTYSDFLTAIAVNLDGQFCRQRTGVLLRRVDDEMSLWVGIPGAQGMSTPMIGVIWPSILKVARSCAHDAPKDARPPAVAEPLARWHDIVGSSRFPARDSPGWFWSSSDEGQAAATEVVAGIRAFCDEFGNVWANSDAVANWIVANRKFSNNALGLLPAFFGTRGRWSEFEAYVDDYLALEATLTHDQVSPLVRTIFINYIAALRARFGK